MTKEEFVNQLEDALVGEVSNAVIYDNKQYYLRYIDGELRNGKSEKEILDELGNPRLIAKTIVETQGDAEQLYKESASFYKEDITENVKNRKAHIYRLDLNTWLLKAIAGTAGILMLVLVIWIISGIISLAIQIAIPVILILAIVYLVKKILDKS